MNDLHQSIYGRIEAFELDEPGAPYPFTARLASENGWPEAYARRVVREYKRFALLAVAAGHPVTPSDQVDQAWHLHLTYTRAYWDRFCGEALGAPLHHNPTAGGPEEKAKFADWYARTLESYRQLFDEEPPSDIWPSAKARFDEEALHRRVSLRDNWVVAKDPVFSVVGFVLFLLALGAVSAGVRLLCRAITGPEPAPVAVEADPFGAAQAQALLVFAGGLAVALATAAILRRLFRRPTGEPAPEALRLDAYETAYLAGGEEAALYAAVAALVSQGTLQVDAAGKKLHRDPGAGPLPGLHAVEQAVLNAVDSRAGSTLMQVRFKVVLPPTLAARLKELGLVVADNLAGTGRALPAAVALLAPLLGIVLMLVGAWRGEPAWFLILPCLVAAGIALGVFARPLHRSRRGDQALDRLRAEHARLPDAIAKGVVGPSGAGVALAVGLFGVAILAGTPWAQLHPLLQPATGGGVGYVGSSSAEEGDGEDGGGGCGGGCGCG